jgi:hypothetical protein
MGLSYSIDERFDEGACMSPAAVLSSAPGPAGVTATI